MSQNGVSLELICRHKEIIFFLFLFFLSYYFGAHTKCSGERDTIGPNLILSCVCVQSQTSCLLTTFAPYSFILCHHLPLFPPLSLTSPTATLRWFNGNYSEMERQRRHSSNWGTHFLTLLKGHLLFR